MVNENKIQISKGVFGVIVLVIVIIGVSFLSNSSSPNELNTANVSQTGNIIEDTTQDINDNDSDTKVPGLGLNFPPQADECLVELYGDDYNQKMISGELDPNDAQNSIQECMEGATETQRRQTSAVFEAVKHFLSR